MKKLIYSAALAAILIITTTNTISAQDNWVQGKKGIYSVGIGGTSAILFGHSGFGYGTAVAGTGVGLSVNVSGEYKVWNWIGVGFQTGINYYGRFGFSSIGIPIAVKANAHIMDALNLDIAKKLDVYAGLNLGGGPAFGVSGGGGGVYGFLQVGPQVGARYWVTEKIGIFGEFGYGATFANVGVTF